MSVEDVLKLVGQFGLPLVLSVFLAIAYDRKEKQHQLDRKEWDDERQKILDAWNKERVEREERSREDAERTIDMFVEAHKNNAAIVSGANDMRTAFEQEKREIKEREILEIKERGVQTGQQQRPRLPRGGT